MEGEEVIPPGVAPDTPPDPATASLEGPKPKRLLCTVENCTFSTPHSKDLGRHMRKHTGEKPFKCHLCDKAYSRNDKLGIHVKVHLNQKTFKCEICQYSAVDSSSLRKHRRVHNDERPYKCQLCPYAAKESSQLVVHVRIHTGDLPYSCMIDWCDAAFKTRSDLVRHSRIHSKEKPYACPHCPYKAAVKCNLNLHLRKVHQELGRISDGKNGGGDLPPKTSREPQKVILESEPAFQTTISGPNELTEIPTGQVSNTEFISSLPPQEKSNAEESSSRSKVSVIKKVRPVGRPRSTSNRIVRRPPTFECSFCKASFVCKSSLRCHLRQHQHQPDSAAVADDSQEKRILVPDTSSKSNPPSLPLEAAVPAAVQSQSHYLSFLNVTSTTGAGDGLFTSSYPNLNFNTNNT